MLIGCMLNNTDPELDKLKKIIVKLTKQEMWWYIYWEDRGILEIRAINCCMISLCSVRVVYPHSSRSPSAAPPRTPILLRFFEHSSSSRHPNFSSPPNPSHWCHPLVFWPVHKHCWQLHKHKSLLPLLTINTWTTTTLVLWQIEWKQEVNKSVALDLTASYHSVWLTQLENVSRSQIHPLWPFPIKQPSWLAWVALHASWSHMKYSIQDSTCLQVLSR